ncbi:MAG: hypothetical protein QXT68_02065 [Halobacteria archaeon]
MAVPPGYLSGNPRRRQALEVLRSRGPLPLAGMAHLLRMPPKMAEGLLEDLRGKGLVEARGERFRLTGEGEEILKRFGREG